MSEELSSVAKEILRYMLANPEAHDTAGGIAHWWLFDRYLDLVEAALDQLVAQDLVTARKSPGSRPTYRLNRDRLAEIEAIFAGETR